MWLDGKKRGWGALGFGVPIHEATPSRLGPPPTEMLLCLTALCLLLLVLFLLGPERRLRRVWRRGVRARI